LVEFSTQIVGTVQCGAFVLTVSSNSKVLVNLSEFPMFGAERLKVVVAQKLTRSQSNLA